MGLQTRQHGCKREVDKKRCICEWGSQLAAMCDIFFQSGGVLTDSASEHRKHETHIINDRLWNRELEREGQNSKSASDRRAVCVRLRKNERVQAGGIVSANQLLLLTYTTKTPRMPEFHDPIWTKRMIPPRTNSTAVYSIWSG